VVAHLAVLQNHNGTVDLIFLARLRIAEHIEVELLVALVGFGFVV
jgi:hypothetical protein